MSDKVIALTSEEIICGKKVGGSKKKFTWTFQIQSQHYTLQLASSVVSGKKTIHLNNVEIYSQQNVFNINFDFNHDISGHNIRIIKGDDTLHTFDLRIDNRSFQYLLNKKKTMDIEGRKPSIDKKPSKYEKTNDDPFLEFQSLAQNSQNDKNDFNPFGQFADFENLDFKKVDKNETKQTNEVQQASNEALFTTNSLKNISEGLNNEEDGKIYPNEEANFATNAFSLNNNYLDLVNAREAQSEQYGYYDPSEKVTTLDKMKLDLTGKQMMNKTKAAAAELKMKATDFIDSLL